MSMLTADQAFLRTLHTQRVLFLRQRAVQALRNCGHIAKCALRAFFPGRSFDFSFQARKSVIISVAANTKFYDLVLE